MLEMKYLEQEMKPLKYIIRDAVIVFVSSLASAFGVFYMKNSISDFLNVVTENKGISSEATQIFTDAPEF